MSHSRHNLLNTTGSSLLEVVLALAIFGLLAATIVTLVVGSFATLDQGGDQTEAEALAQEGIEAVRSIRDRAFNELRFATSGVALNGLYDGPATWWDMTYNLRHRLTISTGANDPDGGYNGYTVRLSNFDTQTLVSSSTMQSDCDDLRIVYWDGSSNTELDRLIIDCNTTTTDVRFALAADIPASTDNGDYYLYFDSAEAESPPADILDVYLWYDDMSSDSSSDYSFGSCGITSIYNAWSYDSNGYFSINTQDNGGGCFRRAVDERDAYIEAEWYHTSCQPINMVSGMLGRWVGTGSGGSENDTQYYKAARTHNPQCGGGYSSDGDIRRNNGTAVDGTNESGIVEDQWRKQGMAIWGVNPTHGKYWNADTVSGFGPVGWPSIGTTASGTDATDQELAGDWGVDGHQDTSRVRNLLIRRYTEPEPEVTLATEVEALHWILRGEGVTDTIGKFSRTITLETVCRNASHAIVDCPGSYTDIHTLKADVSVTWSPRSGVTNEVERTSYITNWDSWEWTQTDWDGGSGQSIWSIANQFNTSTNVVTSTDGQLTLAAGSTLCASSTWDFSAASDYTFDSDDITVTSSNAQLVAPYATDRPTIHPNTSFTPPIADIWVSFTENATKPAGTEIYYQLSADNGATWQYWDGSSWASASTTNYNTASVVNDNIWEFSTASSSIVFKAFLESNGSAQVQLDSVDIDCRNLQYEIGSVTTDETWTSVTFNNTYEAPVIFTIYEESNNTLPASPRPRNLSGTGVELRLQHWDDQNLSSDVIRYWVIEEGMWMIDDTLLEAHTFDTDTVGHNTNGNGQDWVGDTITYNQTYSSPPLVFHQVQTNNDSEWIVTWASADGDRTNPPGTTTAQVALNGAEAYSSHGTETVGWLAIEANVTGTIGNNTFETFRIPDNDGNVGGHDDGCNTRSYQLTYDTAPATFAYSQEFDGGNGGWTVICSPGNTTEIGFHLEEDQSLDSERGHFSEITGYIAFDGDITNSADSGFVATGTLRSSAFNLTDASPVQIIDWDETIPVACSASCDVEFQLRTAPDNLGSPGTWTDWYGVSGTSTYFTNPNGSLAPIDINWNRWLQYQVLLSSDGNNTPVLTEVRVNYK